MKPFYLNIDILGFGACNLTCPSCPVGNARDVPNPKGMMDGDLLRRILEKATAEVPIRGVGLYNWTEPLLHPRLPEMIRIVNSFGLECDISSNLNSIKGLEEMLAAEPYTVRISNSGFTQEHYGATHRGGDIERVKENMRILMETRDRLGVSTKVYMLYHRYRDNLDDERKMREYCISLGIFLAPVWALFQPLEKVLAMADDDPSIANVTDEDRATMRRLLVPPTSALQVAQRHRGVTCRMQEEEITIDCKGNVVLCCVVYDSTKYGLGSFLDQSIADIQRQKYSSKLCDRCMSHGAHAYFSYRVPAIQQLAEANASSKRDAAFLAENPALVL